MNLAAYSAEHREASAFVRGPLWERLLQSEQWHATDDMQIPCCSFMICLHVFRASSLQKPVQVTGNISI